MENRFEHIDELVALVISGEASDANIRLVEEWVAISKENAFAFQTSKKLFDQIASLKVASSVDTDKAWLNVKKRIGENDSRIKVISISSRPWQSVFRIAAILAIVAGLSATVYFLFNSELKANDKVISSADSVRNESFPDGSLVILNRKSTISYSSTGYNGKRTVQLSGEAFFDVKHDEQNAFTVEAGGLIIKDVGTSFNVKAYPDSKLIIVTVETGEVKIFTVKQQGISIAAGESASFNSTTGEIIKTVNEDKNLSAYKDKVFIFDNTELKVIVKLLNDIYGKNIVLGDADLDKCRLTATFNNESLELIIGVIAETLQLEVSKTETEIRLNGNGCK